MKNTPTSPQAYLASLPPDRRAAIQAIRDVINKNLGKGFAEGVQYGMMAWFVPHEVYPPGYHCDPKQPLPFVSVASQKSHIGIYLFCIYMDAGMHRAFIQQWKASGKKLDMGKACIRVKDLDGVPLDVLGEVIRGSSVESFIATYEAALPEKVRATRAKSAVAGSTTSSAKPSSKKTPKKSASAPSSKKKGSKATARKRAAKPAAKNAPREAAEKSSKKVARKTSRAS